ncbi:MAG: hypothetical protein QMD11_12530 [Smithella sp.]|nr:hypothetical protein [Smithella sp.]
MINRIYSAQQEENIYIRNQAKTWHRSGLINNDQLTAAFSHTDPDVRQTNVFFRIIFFVFTCIFIGAVLGLFMWMTGIRKPVPVSFVLIISSVISYFAGEYAINKYRIYRHGIEEALALAAMAFLCFGCGTFLNETVLTSKQTGIVITLLCACFACWIYLRFGFLYAAFICVCALCTLPFQFSLTPLTERLFLLVVLCLILFLSAIFDNDENEDFRKEKDTVIQACVLAGLYLTINLEILGAVGGLTGNISSLHLRPKAFPPYVYWASYVLTFIIPIVGIYWGIKSRKRLILNLSLVMTCVTMATNKSYLGITRYTWDPAILGTALVIISMAINIWLNRGENKQRDGFTAENILKPESHGIGLADIAAAVTPLATNIEVQQQDKYFDGGTSGGGGTSRGY